MQQVDARGDGNQLAVVSGDGIRVSIGREGHRLELARRHIRAMRVRTDLDLLNPFTRAVPLVGRDGDLAALRDWLTSPAAVSVRCLTGRAGSG